MNRSIQALALSVMVMSALIPERRAMSNEIIQGPKTLFEMAEVAQPKPSWDRSVLVIIDAQKEYETGRLALPHIKPAIAAIKSLLIEARRRRVPVVHVIHEGGRGLFDPLADGFKIIDALAPADGEIVIRKRLPDAFAGTRLQSTIDQLGKDRKLILTGFMTHMCITATAMSALNLGYESFVVEDAVATRALVGSDGKVISDLRVNEASLAGLKDRVAWVIRSEELLR